MYSFVDTAFRILRVLVLLAGFSVFVLAFVDVVRDEDAADALAAYLVGGGTLLVALWAWSELWLLWWIGFAGVAAGFAVAGRPAEAVLALVALAAPVVPGVAVDRRYLQSFRESELALTGPGEAVPAEDEATVAALEAGGYRQLGVHRWRLGENVGVTTLLVGRERDRIAGVTGGELELVSRFGDRTLVTSMRARQWPATRTELCQRIAYGRFQAVQAAHQRALGILVARKVRPDTFETNAEAAAFVRASVEKLIERISGRPLRTYLASSLHRHAIEHVLGDDERSRRRIDAWLEARA